MKKSNKKGFTLVELVVVIAIIGVLAAILVPSMMGYVKKSRLKTANSNAKTAYNSIAGWVADMETKGTPVTWGTTEVKIDCKTGTATAGTTTTTTGLKDDEKKALGSLVQKCLADNGENAGEALVCGQYINGNSNAFFVQWHKGSSDTTIGQYPNPIDDDQLDKMKTSNFGQFYNGKEFKAPSLTASKS